MPNNLLIQSAITNVKTILSRVFEHDPDGRARALLVYDDRCFLSQILAESYRTALPQATVLNFDKTDAVKIQGVIQTLTPGDLVILVQSTSFRLDEFRIRIQLFKQGLKVIEHPHLERLQENEIATYMESLAYDESYYRHVGPALKTRLDKASEVIVSNGSSSLTYKGPFESAKLNIGDYRGMKNSGGQFPIGEVFTEPVDLKGLSGEALLYAYGNREFRVQNADPPILLKIREGKVVAAEHSNTEFDEVLKGIASHEGDIWVRELGFGLNRAMTRERQVRDVGIYERMCGVHLSLGSKHLIYPKAGFHKKKVKFHVDVFVATDEVRIDGEVIYRNGHYTI